MFICPVCSSRNASALCSVCGFDESQNYERYPTFSRLSTPVNAVSRRVAQRSSYYRCVNCGGIRFNANIKTGQLVCEGCKKAVDAWKLFPGFPDSGGTFPGKEVPVLGDPKFVPDSSPVVIKSIGMNPTKETASSSSHAPAATAPQSRQESPISGFDDYMNALEQCYLKKEKRPLTEQEITDFLTLHHLHSRYRSQVSDDLNKIYAKYAPPKKSPQTKPTMPPQDFIKAFEAAAGQIFGKSAPSRKAPQTKPIMAYPDYLEALENLYLKNGKKSLSAAQISDFITSNHLDSRFGIQKQDVESDLKKIIKNHSQ